MTLSLLAARVNPSASDTLEGKWLKMRTIVVDREYEHYVMNQLTLTSRIEVTSRILKNLAWFCGVNM